MGVVGVAVAVSAVWALAPALTAAEPRFDIAYLWDADLDKVRDYRERLAPVLGPGIRQRLLIVRGEQAYGVVYARDGDASSTDDVARGHARLLRARGLEGAAPILSRRWTLVGDRAGAPSATAAPPTPVSRSRFPARVAPVLASRRLPAALSAAAAPGSDLEARIQSLVARQRQRGRVTSDERTSWAVYDLVRDRKLAAINADLPLQAASLIKPAVAVAFFHRVAEGRLTYGSRSRARMEAMLRRSDNPASNWVMRHVGGPRGAEALLRRHYGDIFRDLQLVEYIPRGGRTYRNRDSVNDYLRLLYAIWHDQVPHAAELRRLMALENRDRFTQNLPASVRVYDKTGSTRSVCGNIGILETHEGGQHLAYALVGVIEKQGKASHYGSWIRSRGDVIRDVSDLVYRQLSSASTTAASTAGAR